MKLTTRALGLFSILGATALASAQAPTIDGTRDASYGSAIALQTNPTGFGDSQNGTGGSELDGAYAKIVGDTAYVFLAGNLETNYNKLDLFIDTDGAANGQNRLLGNNTSVDFNGLNSMGDDGSGNGLTFDAGFYADDYITLGGDGTNLYVNYATLPTGGNGTGGYQGVTGYGSNGVLTGGDAGSVGIRATVNDSNNGGVDGGSLNDPGSVTTGIELAIPLSALGNPAPGANLRFTAFINSGDHTYASNQFLGGLPSGTPNIGGLGANGVNGARLLNLSTYAGDQFFSVANPVPEPTTVAALGLGALAFVRRRRKG